MILVMLLFQGHSAGLSEALCQARVARIGPLSRKASQPDFGAYRGLARVLFFSLLVFCKRAGVKRACPNKVMAHIWFMHEKISKVCILGAL